jgi:hypothetical protein
VVATLLALALGAAAAPAPAAPPTPAEAAGEKVIPLERYTTPKGQTLARAHQQRLQKYAEQVWGCLPWLDIQKQSIGFQRPKGAPGDDRYFSTWILIPQAENAQFAALPQTRRMSAMFSRYGVDMLRRMADIHDVLADSNVHGFSVVLSWLKPGTSRQPVNESVAAFIDKATGLDFLERRIPHADFARRMRVLGFDGQTDLGPQTLDVWDDDFAATFRMPNYEPPAGIIC